MQTKVLRIITILIVLVAVVAVCAAPGMAQERQGGGGVKDVAAADVAAPHHSS